MGFLRKIGRRILSKISFSPKAIFGRYVDSLDGGSYEYQNQNNNTSSQTEKTQGSLIIFQYLSLIFL